MYVAGSLCNRPRLGAMRPGETGAPINQKFIRSDVPTLHQVHAAGADRATQSHDLSKHQASTLKLDLDRHFLKFDAETHTDPRMYFTASQVGSNPGFRHDPIERMMMERIEQRD